MSDPRIRLVMPEPKTRPVLARRPLGRLLVEDGYISATNLMTTLGAQHDFDAQIGDLLVARGMLDENDLYQTLAKQHEGQFVSLKSAPPDFSLQATVDPIEMLHLKFVPWRKLNNATLIATSRPDNFWEIQAAVPAHFHPVVMAIVPDRDLERVVRMASGTQLARHAETRVPSQYSCRALPAHIKTFVGTTLFSVAVMLMLGWITLGGLYASVFYFAISMVIVGILLKTTGAALQLLSNTPIFARKAPLPAKLPPVSLLIALHDETNILPLLIERLSLLKYPKELLDVKLIIEQSDHAMHEYLAVYPLPAWIQVLSVPDGDIKTKPRALNYALPFCKGQIVGVYDAEDAPDPEQLRDVVRTFADQPLHTACIQAVLDYYNPTRSIITRMFTIEYATWFRLVLPGVARLGFAIPLGGTSVFFRRHALEELQGWDAHNVTEDADLGIRLSRAGYRTVLINSVTMEEANAKVWPWIRQRSRWLKGYLITYFTHMRNPLRLLMELGLWKFLGFQAFFLSAISQYMLAPLIWSCMALYFGVPDWLETALPQATLERIVISFIGMWAMSTSVYLIAIWGPKHRYLWPWVFGMSPYLGLGTLAIYKGAWELARKPFFWDKTAHGISQDISEQRAE